MIGWRNARLRINLPTQELPADTAKFLGDGIGMLIVLGVQDRQRKRRAMHLCPRS